MESAWGKWRELQKNQGIVYLCHERKIYKVGKDRACSNKIWQISIWISGGKRRVTLGEAEVREYRVQAISAARISYWVQWYVIWQWFWRHCPLTQAVPPSEPFIVQGFNICKPKQPWDLCYFAICKSWVLENANDSMGETWNRSKLQMVDACHILESRKGSLFVLFVGVDMFRSYGVVDDLHQCFLWISHIERVLTMTTIVTIDDSCRRVWKTTSRPWLIDPEPMNMDEVWCYINVHFKNGSDRNLMTNCLATRSINYLESFWKQLSNWSLRSLSTHDIFDHSFAVARWLNRVVSEGQCLASFLHRRRPVNSPSSPRSDERSRWTRPTNILYMYMYMFKEF